MNNWKESLKQIKQKLKNEEEQRRLKWEGKRLNKILSKKKSRKIVDKEELENAMEILKDKKGKPIKRKGEYVKRLNYRKVWYFKRGEEHFCPILNSMVLECPFKNQEVFKKDKRGKKCGHFYKVDNLNYFCVSGFYGIKVLEKDMELEELKLVKKPSYIKYEGRGKRRKRVWEKEKLEELMEEENEELMEEKNEEKDNGFDPVIHYIDSRGIIRPKVELVQKSLD